MAGRLYRFWMMRLVPRLSLLANSHRSRNQTVLRWPNGPMVLGPRVCVFIHWDGAGEVREYVLLYLRALQGCGVSVVFVSNAERLRPASLAAVQALCAGVIVRRNIGYDFGAWAAGIEAIGPAMPGVEMLYLANDSVYGPLAPLDKVLEQFDFTEADVWGCTESYQSRYHLQSYLLGFSARVLAHPAWATFWARVRPANKQYVVYHYEVGLSQAMLRAGFRCRAVWSYQTLLRGVDASLLRAPDPEETDEAVAVRRQHVARIRGAAVHRNPMNPTAELWRQLLHAGFPFIKRELLRSNPSRVLDVSDWQEVVRDTSAGDIGPIERDLQRTLQGRAP